MNLSQYQQDILAFATASRDNFIIDAVAGSGKTTTAVLVGKAIGVNETTFLAFNKAIASELQERGLPYAATFHSAAFGTLKSARGKLEVDNLKGRRLLQKILPKDGWDDYGAATLRVVSLLKQYCFRPEQVTRMDVDDLVSNFEIDFGGELYLLFRYSQQLLTAMVESFVKDKPSVDFDDMLYAPWYFGIPFELAPTIILDEAQDTNRLQRELLKTSNARIIAVGDPYQAIYGFRGASSDSMQQIAADFKCKALPLSTSYRCARNIIREAQKLVPHIEYFEAAPEGTVSECESIGEALHRHPTNTAVLCRMNAPLIALFFDLAAQGKAVAILGSDIGKALAKTLDDLSSGVDDYDEFFVRLDEWRESEKRKARKTNRSEHLVDEKVDCLETIAHNWAALGRPVNTVSECALRIFTDAHVGGDTIVLATVHKAKGREWDNVIIYGPEFMPPPWVDPTSWQMQQELNLRYVATTRAKLNLVTTKIERKE